jgi:hypothetical protein
MDILRRTDLRNSLEHELAFETRHKQLTSHGRVKWLIGMLSEYVERWNGFCQPPFAGMHDAVQDSGFAMIEIGAALLSRELRMADPPIVVFDAWLHFISCLSEMRDRADFRLLNGLVSGMRQVEAAMATWKGE